MLGIGKRRPIIVQKGEALNPRIAAIVAWCAIGAIAMSWFWYEADGNVRRTFPMRLAELLLGPLLWPLAVYSAWIWWRSRISRVEDFRRTSTPHCPRHGHILLKCEHQHEAFCSGCSGCCGICGEGAWFSPRYHGLSSSGDPMIVYEPIHARRTEG